MTIYHINGTISDDAKDIDRLTRDIRNRLRSASIRGVQSTAVRIVEYIKTDVIPSITPHPPFDLGFYSAGFIVWPHDTGADIINRTPYAGVIESGARAANIKVGAEMITNLAMWVKRKGIPLELRPGMDEDKAATKVAFGIAESFKKNGIFRQGKGLRIMAHAMRKLEEFATEEINTEWEIERQAMAKQKTPKADPPTNFQKAMNRIDKAATKVDKLASKFKKYRERVTKLVMKRVGPEKRAKAREDDD